MQQHIRKPQRVTVRAFVTLNDYLADLPTVKDSFMAVEDTKKGNVPFDEADLAGIVLKGRSNFMGESVQSDPFDSPEVPEAVAPGPGEYRARDEQETHGVSQGQG